MPLNKDSKLEFSDIFRDEFLQILKAISELRARQDGAVQFAEGVTKIGNVILGEIQKQKKGDAIAALAFSLVEAVDAWPALKEDLQIKNPIIITPPQGRKRRR